MELYITLLKLDTIKTNLIVYQIGKSTKSPSHPTRYLSPGFESAAKRWRLLNGSNYLPEVIAGVQFIDGINPKSPPPENSHPQLIAISLGSAMSTF